jgi:chorismate lyase/3-hydroxybenzoate synthase
MMLIRISTNRKRGFLKMTQFSRMLRSSERLILSDLCGEHSAEWLVFTRRRVAIADGKSSKALTGYAEPGLINPGMALLGIEPAFDVTFGAQRAELVLQDSRAAVRLPMPMLAGPLTESLEIRPTSCRWDGEFLLAEADDLLVGATLVDAGGRLEDAVEAAYGRLLDLATGWHLFRIWQYVPQINDVRGGLERYRQFNIGRWAAFENRFGRDLRSFMPAALSCGTGRGQGGSHLQGWQGSSDLFSKTPPRCPPTIIRRNTARGLLGLPVGSWRIAPAAARFCFPALPALRATAAWGKGTGSFSSALRCNNIEIMLGRMGCLSGLRPNLWAESGIRDAHFKCYLRHPEILPLVREWLCDSLGTDDHFTYLQADICRMDLDLEIEGRIVGEPCSSD